MTLNKHINGDIIDADETNQDNVEPMVDAGLNSIRQLIDRAGVFPGGGFAGGWGEAYIDANGRGNSVVVAGTGAEFDSNKYKFPDFLGETNYIIIEATSFTGWSNGTNNTYVFLIGTGKWIVFCDTGTDAVKRAQIHESLWYGTNGTNQLILDFTSITTVQSSYADDVGKNGHLALVTIGTSTGNPFTKSGTFGDTSTNLQCSSWSNFFIDWNFGTATARWELPTSTTLHTFTTGSGGSSNEFGTDREADETNNPATCQLDAVFGGNNEGTLKAIVVCKGSLTWADAGGLGNGSSSDIDFGTDNSIPVMIAAGSLNDEVDFIVIEHTIPSGTFNTTISSAIGIPFVEDWETGANIQFKLTNAEPEDSGWLDAMNTEPTISTFSAFTAEPDSLIVRLVPKSSSPTSFYPSIRGFWVRTT